MRIFLYRLFFSVLIILQILLLTSQVFAVDWIQKGIDLNINNQFDRAEKYFKSFILKNPQDYRVYFYYAATLNSKMTHFENNTDEESFDWALDRTIQMIDSIITKSESIADSVHAEHLFYLGSAYGYRAFFQAQNGRWFKALKNGMKSSALLQEAIEKDSTLYDAYLGIGVYRYYRHSVIKYLSWLPFISDDREEGIRLVKKAIEHSRYSKYVAIQQLIYILTDYNKPDEAVEYAKDIIAHYPDSQFMLWAAAHAYHKSGDLKNARATYEHLLDIITRDPEYNPHHLIKCKMKLAEIYGDTGQYKNCLRECEQLLLFLDEDQKEEIERVQNLMKMCKNNLTEQGMSGSDSTL